MKCWYMPFKSHHCYWFGLGSADDSQRWPNRCFMFWMKSCENTTYLSFFFPKKRNKIYKKNKQMTLLCELLWQHNVQEQRTEWMTADKKTDIRMRRQEERHAADETRKAEVNPWSAGNLEKLILHHIDFSFLFFFFLQTGRASCRCLDGSPRRLSLRATWVPWRISTERRRMTPLYLSPAPAEAVGARGGSTFQWGRRSPIVDRDQTLSMLREWNGEERPAGVFTNWMLVVLPCEFWNGGQEEVDVSREPHLIWRETKKQGATQGPHLIGWTDRTVTRLDEDVISKATLGRTNLASVRLFLFSNNASL